MRKLRTGAALLATAVVLTACGDDPTDETATPDPAPSTAESAAELTEEEWNSYMDVAEGRLPATEARVIWSGTVSSGSTAEMTDVIEAGDYRLDLVCVGTGESYIEFTLGDTGLTTSVPCTTAGQLTTRDLSPGGKGSLKISGGSAGGDGGGYGQNVLVGRLTEV